MLASPSTISRFSPLPRLNPASSSFFPTHAAIFPPHNRNSSRGDSACTSGHNSESGWSHIMNHRQSQSSTGHQQHSSYVQPSPCPASYHGTMSQRSSTSTAANVYPSSYAFGLPPPKEQDHPGSRFSQPTTGRSHPTWPSGTTTYRSLLAPVQGYTVPAVTSSSGRQNTPHAQQTHDNASSDGSSASIHRGQLKALIRILRDISQDLHIDGFDEADAKGICQALRKLRECLAAVEVRASCYLLVMMQ